MAERLRACVAEGGVAVETPQAEDGVTYAKKIRPKETKIDWRRAAAEVDRQIRGRAFDPLATVADCLLQPLVPVIPSHVPLRARVVASVVPSARCCGDQECRSAP